MNTALIPLRRITAAALTTLACVTGALAVQPDDLAQAQARYRSDMAVCNSGQSNQMPATCRREAASALAQAKSGAIHNAPGQYQNNALRRCEAHQGDDRAACVARILGQGDITTRAKAGGVLRESITVTPAE
ncbi:hypothetical protein HUU62_03460 [Rhodoferax sp. 4810]|nr:hypothetical protein [Rhodoferax jenense]